MYPNTFKLVIFNLFLLGIFFVSTLYGYTKNFFLNDSSHLTFAIAAIIFINIGLAILDSYKDEKYVTKSNTEVKHWLNWIQGKLPYIGLVGTLYGFTTLMTAINVSSDAQTVIESIKAGCTTLANTTLLGIIGYLWISLNFYLVGEE